MKYKIVGLNFKTAPSRIRGSFAVGPHNRRDIYEKTRSHLKSEFIWLSTCNRTELYVAQRGGIEDRKLLSLFFDVFDTMVSPDYFYIYSDRGAVKHIFEVVTGIDSMVVGEKEIVGQVKEAYRYARSRGTVGKYLDKLFTTALHINKDVRSRLPELSSPLSIPYIGVKMTRDVLGDFKERRFLIIGTGSMGDLVAKNIIEYGGENITFAGKHMERVREIASRWNKEWMTRDEALRSIGEFDGVVVATPVKSPIITDEIFPLPPSHEMVILDISIPRAVEFERVPQRVHVIYLDDLKDATEENRKSREEAVEKAREIIEYESIRFMGWLVEQYVAPMIEKMFDRSEEIRLEMMEDFFSRYRIDEDLRKKIDQYTSQLVKKLIHIHLEKVRMATRGMWDDEIYELIYSIFSRYEKNKSEKIRNEGQSFSSGTGKES